MRARIYLPSGAVVEVEASPEEIRRLAGEPGYKLELLPQAPATNICICGRAVWSIVPPVCPVHGQPFRFNVVANAAAAAAPAFGGQVWIGTIGGQA